MDNLVREFFTIHLHNREGARILLNATRDSIAKRTILLFHDSVIARHKKYLDNSENSAVYNTVLDEFLQARNITLDRNTPEYEQLKRDFILAVMHASEIEKERIQGNYNNWYDDFHSVLKPKNTPQQIAFEKKKVKLLSDVIQEYIKEKTAKGDWNAKNTEESIRLYHQFVEIIGDKPIADFTRDNLIHYVEVLKKLPKNLNKVKELRDKPFVDVLAMMDKGELSKYELQDTTTINKKLVSINSVFRHAHRHGYIPVNFADNLKLKDETRPDEERDPYDVEDLKKWFSSPIFSKYTATKVLKAPERFWIPLIMLFSGCRSGEVCQLYKKDITEIGGIKCFNINQDEDKTIKRMASKRIVPIHPELIKLGFLTYVDSVKHQRLWSNLKKGRDGYAHLFNKWAGRYNRQYVTDNPKKVPYSFRHNFTNSLKQNKVQRELADELTGHAVQGETYGRYGKQFNVKAKYEAVKKVKYLLSFSHIKYPFNDFYKIDRPKLDEIKKNAIILQKKFKRRTKYNKENNIINTLDEFFKF